jgi:hypothetical protein
LVDRVLPHAPYRQWTFTMPWDLARSVAFDSSLSAAVFGIFADGLKAFYEARAREEGIAAPHAGCLLEIQRFADGARLWPHAHALTLEGVYYEAGNGNEDRDGNADAEVRFHRTRPPTQADLDAIVAQVAARIHRLLRRRALLQGDSDRSDCLDIDEPRTAHRDDSPAGDGASLEHGRQLLMQWADVRELKRHVVPGYEHYDRRVRQRDAHRGYASKGRFRAKKDKGLSAATGGFEIRADPVIAAKERASLERLLRYMARPPVPSERIRLRDDGRLTFYLKRMWKGGVNALVYEPLALIARIATLIPPPGFNLRRFYGIFAPNHPLRPRIVPKPPDPDKTGHPVAPPRPAQMAWADLLKRVFLVDVLRCPDCGGRMRIIATVKDPSIDEALLADLVLNGRLNLELDSPRGPPAHRGDEPHYVPYYDD